MAVFNPDPGGTPSANMPDQTGASRGMAVNESFGIALKGAGNLVGGIIQAYDEQQRYDINKDVNDAFTKLTEPLTPNDKWPKNFKETLGMISKIEAAHSQGILNDEAYYGRLTVISKDLRVKYPGYEDVVDATIQNVTGVRPANMYREALQQKLAKEASANAKAQSDWDQTLKDFGPELTTLTAGNLFDHPELYTSDAARAQLRNQAIKIRGMRSEATYLQTQDEKVAYQKGLNYLSSMTDISLSAMATNMGFKDKTVREVVQMAANHQMTPEQEATVVTQLKQLYDESVASYNSFLTQQITVEGADPSSYQSFGGILGETKGKEIVNMSLAPLKAMVDAAGVGDWTTVNSTLKRANAIQDELAGKLLSGNQNLQYLEAIKSIDPQLAADFDTKFPQLRENILTQISSELAARVASGNGDLQSVLTGIAEDTTKPEADRVAGLNSSLDKVLYTVENGTGPDLSNTVKSVYGDDPSSKELFSLVDDASKDDLFFKKFSLEKTANILKNGSQEDIKAYQNAAIETLANVPTLQSAASNIQQGITRGMIQLTTDESGRVYIEPTQKAIDETLAREGLGNNPSFDNQVKQRLIDNAHAAADTLNGIFGQLDPIFLPDGAPPADVIDHHAQIASYLNLDFSSSAKPEANFFQGLLDMFENFNKGNDEAQAALAQSFSDISNTLNFSVAPTQDYGTITNTIIGFEGYRNVAYDDNHTGVYRIGYGSDTITLADGTVVHGVKPGDKITQADAERDLQRRIDTEFIPEIKNDIGEDVWTGLSEPAQAALTSIAYNYGSLPSAVVKAAKSGDKVALFAAIMKLQTHNDGINASRRAREASMVLQ